MCTVVGYLAMLKNQRPEIKMLHSKTLLNDNFLISFESCFPCFKVQLWHFSQSAVLKEVCQTVSFIFRALTSRLPKNGGARWQQDYGSIEPL